MLIVESKRPITKINRGERFNREISINFNGSNIQNGIRLACSGDKFVPKNKSNEEKLFEENPKWSNINAASHGFQSPSSQVVSMFAKT